MAAEKHFFVALGANTPSFAGAPEQTLHAAVDRLGVQGVDCVSMSPFYDTPCFPVGAGPDYVNATICAAYNGTPQALLAILHEIESEFGRERVQRWGQRVLDLDLIAAGDQVLPDHATYEAWRTLPAERQKQDAPEELILPHPRIQDRAFVLVPLADIAPDWVHPVLGESVREMLAKLDKSEVDQVRPI